MRKQGLPLLMKNRTVSLDSFLLTVMIPEFNGDDDAKHYVERYKESHKLEDGEAVRFRIMYDPKEADNNALSMYDIPMTLTAVFRTVNYILDGPVNSSEDAKAAKWRALENFYDHLVALINQNSIIQPHVKLIHGKRSYHQLPQIL